MAAALTHALDAPPSKLRDLGPLIEREYKTMAIVVNVEDCPLLREPIDRAHAEGLVKGQAQGEARIIERILRTRFGDYPRQPQDDLCRSAGGDLHHC